MGREVQKQDGINWEAFGRAVKQHHYDMRLALVKTLLTGVVLAGMGAGAREACRSAHTFRDELARRLAATPTRRLAGRGGSSMRSAELMTERARTSRQHRDARLQP